MTTNRKITQLTLVTIGILLIASTYFFYPIIIKNKHLKGLKKETVIKEDIITKESKESNIFENVEYQGIYNIKNPFKVKSEEAYILIEEPDIVYMQNMRVTLYVEDGRIITITSDKGKYNKVSYDCYFEVNVKATDGETVILSENIDLLATENSASIYNNVVLTSAKSTLLADRVDYDFEKKFYNISMFNNEKVKIKLIE